MTHRIRTIATHHAERFRTSRERLTLEEHIENAITEALDSVFEKECVQELRRLENDREAYAAENTRLRGQIRELLSPTHPFNAPKR